MRPGETEDDAGAFPPLRVFFVLMAVVVAVGAVVLVTREDSPPPPPPTQSPSPNFALTDAEAIARFKELRELRDQLYRERDLSLLSEIYAPDSPIVKIVTKEIKQLLRDNVLHRSRYETHRVSVSENFPGHIVVTEVVTRYPRFVSEDGEDVTRNDAELLQKATWSLVEMDGRWLVDRSVIQDSRKVDG